MGDDALRNAARAGKLGGSAEEARCVGFLSGLPPVELARVLQSVFNPAGPFPEEIGHCRSKFFLGFASLDRVSVPGEPWEWGPWRMEVIAPPALDGACVHQEFSEAGRCSGCRADLRSNSKSASCPICGREVGLT